MAIRLASVGYLSATLRTSFWRSNSRVVGSPVGLRSYATEGGETKEVAKTEGPSAPAAAGAPKGNIGRVSVEKNNRKILIYCKKKSFFLPLLDWFCVYVTKGRCQSQLIIMVIISF